MPAPTPSQVEGRMRHASLALLGAAVQLRAIGDLAAPAGEPVTASDIAADMMWRLARDTRDSLASAERVRRRYCEVKGLTYTQIIPAELALAFRATDAIPETLITVDQPATTGRRGW